MMKRGTQLKLKQLGVILIAWIILGFIVAVYDHLVIHTRISLGPSEQYVFGLSLLRNMGAGLIGALLGGSLLVFYINEKYRDKPYGYTIAMVYISFICIIGIITLIMGAILTPLQTGAPLSATITQKAYIAFITDSYPIKNAFVWAFLVALTQLLLQISSKFGHQTFWHIISGKYHMPKKEKRIFMFLDLNASTTIAEQLGNENYHALLKDFFADITTPILENRGHIYQYVGDEVVVAWSYKDGLMGAQCLKCFFDIKQTISGLKAKYEQRYGLVPSFKAGIHSGDVIAGEVGIVKRDITYSGDVLNTTSRILGKCNEFHEEIIISADLLAMLHIARDYGNRVLGSIQLRGKQQKVAIHALFPK